jgi:hypothetical protein
MKKIALVFMLLALVACATEKRYLPPQEEQKITSVSDTSKCQFIKKDVSKSWPEAMVKKIKLNVYYAGGDSYKIISTDTSMNATVVNFEIWKCK